MWGQPILWINKFRRDVVRGAPEPSRGLTGCPLMHGGQISTALCHSLDGLVIVPPSAEEIRGRERYALTEDV